MDVLFLSVSTGAGHIKAAQHLQEYIESTYPGSRTLLIDALEYASPWVHRLIVGGYLGTVRNIPQVYGKLYTLSESDEMISNLSKTLSRWLAHRLLKLIEGFNPAVVVCTHTLPLQMMSCLKLEGKINIPVVAIVTDFANHLFWKLEKIDALVVAHDYIKHEMINMGIPEETLYTYGIPVSMNLLQKKDRHAILREFKLEDKTTVLIMGGSLGYGKILDTFKSLLESKKDIQILTVAGRNDELKKQLEYYAEKSKKCIRIFGYTNRIAELMDIADFIITKPGGMTLSEALVKQLPILTISPIPGQEERNAHFLINSGAAATLLPGDHPDSLLSFILGNPLRLAQMKKMAGFLAKPKACEDIAGLLENLASKAMKNERSAAKDAQYS